MRTLPSYWEIEIKAMNFTQSSRDRNQSYGFLLSCHEIKKKVMNCPQLAVRRLAKVIIMGLFDKKSYKHDYAKVSYLNSDLF